LVSLPSLSKQGTKIAEKGFWGKEIQNTKTHREISGRDWCTFEVNFDEYREGNLRYRTNFAPSNVESMDL
jgi:hypothetical protein